MTVRIASLESLQRLVALALMLLAAIHVPCLAAIAALRSLDWLTVGLTAAALAAVPALLYAIKRPLLVVAFALTVTLVGQTSLLVFVMKGHPWQIEMHFYYFAVLAMLSGFCGWRTVVLAAALIAAEHLIMNALLPEAIFPGGSNVLRVLVHAVVVVIESIMLIGIGLAIRNAFGEAETARQAAEQAASALEQAASTRESEFRSAKTRADNAAKLLVRFEAEMTTSIEALHGSAETMLACADRLGASTAQGSARAVTVSIATEDTARKVEIAARTGEALALAIAEVGSQAVQSSELAVTAVADAEKTNNTINEMDAVAREIAEVTQMISGIAAQTNLLALNATIEAARAGEAGRGFSVVAQEVKGLASQTASATQDIATRIQAMQAATGRSVSAIYGISLRIKELEDLSARIAAAVEEQGAATRDIACSVASAAVGVGHVERSMAEISTLAEANVGAVSEVSTAANQVVGQARILRTRLHAFTEDIRRMSA